MLPSHYNWKFVQGIPKNEIKDEVHKTLRDIDLQDTAKLRVKNLSGGQKRKLSVGIAIIGDPKVDQLKFERKRK